jgi:hypothetical protein
LKDPERYSIRRWIQVGEKHTEHKQGIYIEDSFPDDTSPRFCPSIFDLSSLTNSEASIELHNSESTYVWYTRSGNKDGLKSYLDYERRQNRQMEKLDYVGR